jgi:hypothetical protein
MPAETSMAAPIKKKRLIIILFGLLYIHYSTGISLRMTDLLCTAVISHPDVPAAAQLHE